MADEPSDEPTDELTTVVRQTEGGACRVTVRGEIDFATVTGLRKTLDALPDAEKVTLVIDLRGVTYLDSAGVDVLFEQARRRWIEVVVAPGAPIVRVLEISGLAKSVPVYVDEDNT